MSIRRIGFLSALATMLVVVSMGWSSTIAAPPDHAGRTFWTDLAGENEVNSLGQPNQGDLDGSGTARITLNAGKSTVCFDIDVTGIAPVRAAHIHSAPAGSNGGIVVNLVLDGGPLSGCTENVSRDIILDILTHPADFYVNVHNADYPNGALRGQLG